MSNGQPGAYETALARAQENVHSCLIMSKACIWIRLGAINGEMLDTGLLKISFGCLFSYF